MIFHPKLLTITLGEAPSPEEFTKFNLVWHKARIMGFFRVKDQKSHRVILNHEFSVVYIWTLFLTSDRNFFQHALSLLGISAQEARKIINSLFPGSL